MDNSNLKKMTKNMFGSNNYFYIALAVILSGFFIYYAGYVLGKFFYYFKH